MSADRDPDMPASSYTAEEVAAYTPQRLGDFTARRAVAILKPKYRLGPLHPGEYLGSGAPGQFFAWTSTAGAGTERTLADAPAFGVVAAVAAHDSLDAIGLALAVSAREGALRRQHAQWPLVCLASTHNLTQDRAREATIAARTRNLVRDDPREVTIAHPITVTGPGDEVRDAVVWESMTTAAFPIWAGGKLDQTLHVDLLKAVPDLLAARAALRRGALEEAAPSARRAAEVLLSEFPTARELWANPRTVLDLVTQCRDAVGAAAPPAEPNPARQAVPA